MRVLNFAELPHENFSGIINENLLAKRYVSRQRK